MTSLLEDFFATCAAMYAGAGRHSGSRCRCGRSRPAFFVRIFRHYSMIAGTARFSSRERAKRPDRHPVQLDDLKPLTPFGAAMQCTPSRLLEQPRPARRARRSRYLFIMLDGRRVPSVRLWQKRYRPSHQSSSSVAKPAAAALGFHRPLPNTFSTRSGAGGASMCPVYLTNIALAGVISGSGAYARLQ